MGKFISFIGNSLYLYNHQTFGIETRNFSLTSSDWPSKSINFVSVILASIDGFKFSFCCI